jgi:16S rRNA (adenine1518-N6/adenine1519-N6)-dimethyltransferase
MKPRTRPPARSHGAAGSHFARKAFGQHFLSDDAVLDSIARIIAPAPDEVLIEIGPGLGALTERLLERCDRLIAIEIDRDLAPKLKARFGARLELVQADVLQVDFAQFVKLGQSERKLRITGNLPYNISSPLLFHLLPHAAHIQDQCFMLQKEVIDRMVAAPGSKAFGRLSVMLQWRYRMANVLHVPPEAFDPPPRVDSAVVQMRPLTEPATVNFDLLESLVKAGFSQRRKLLRHALEPWLAQHGLDTLSFNLQRRAEEVSTSEWVAWAQRVVPNINRGEGSAP